MTLGGWLRSLGLEQYEAAFRENAIDDAVLSDLTEDHLREIGIPLGARIKLLKAIAALSQRTNTIAPTGIKAAERRQVTVMFCDLVGSTVLAANMDPEDLREVISAYQKCAAQTVRRFDGFVARYMGDGVLVYFGYPQAHEDDAERAAHAGLELIADVAKLSTPAPLQTRVGIATGLVVVGDLVQEHDIVGETPNLAARLQGIAEPNTVVIADATRRLLGSLFDLKDLGAYELKGIARPTRAWSVLRPSSMGSRFEALHAGHLTALVGREEEMDLLTRRWSKAKTGEGQVVLLSGEAGIGKSRLTAAVLERLATEPHTRLRYFCSPQHTDSAFYPIIGQIERAAHLAQHDILATKLDKLDAMLAQTSTKLDAALIAELLSLRNDGRYPALDLAPQQRRQKTLEALISHLEGLTRFGPVLMIFEDAHWSDPSSFEVLGQTVDRIATLPLLLIVTFRPEFEPPWIGQPHVTALTINRLTERHVEAMLDRLIGKTLIPTSIRQDIIERTDGIPLFVEEMTKAVLEAGGEDEAQRTVVAIPSPAISVLASLHASLIARLDRLGPAKEVAQIGATIGREFSHALLAAVVGKPEAELGSALERLAAVGLLFRQGVLPHVNYLFKHALVQEAAYGTLLRSRRREIHARIVRALEDDPAAATSQPEILAHHCASAGLTAKAIFYWQKAGERSKARSAMLEAIAQIEKALDLLRALPDGPDRQRAEIELRLALGGALLAARGHASEEMGKSYARARYLSELLGDTPNLLKALWGEFVHHHVRAETARSHRAAEKLLHLAEAQNDTAAMVAGHRAIGDSLLHLGHFGRARTHLEHGLILYDPVEHRPLTLLFAENAKVAILSFLSLTLAILGLPDQAKLRSGEALAEARGSAHPISVAFALSTACRLYFVLRDSHMVRQLAEELIALTTEQRFTFFLATGTTYCGWARVETGDVVMGADELRRGIAGFRASGAGWILSIFLDQLASAHAKAGQMEDGLGRISEALVLTDKSELRWFEAELHRRRSELLSAGRPGAEAEAEECLHRAISIAREQDAKLWELRSATNLARLWRDQCKRSEAQNLLAPIYGWFTEGFDTLDLKEAKALLDTLGS
jgi:class 3 adenylate cyclase/predicted ATPase